MKKSLWTAFNRQLYCFGIFATVLQPSLLLALAGCFATYRQRCIASNPEIITHFRDASTLSEVFVS